MPYIPSEAGQIVRLHVRMPPWYPVLEEDKMFIFEGELVDIWESGKSMARHLAFYIVLNECDPVGSESRVIEAAFSFPSRILTAHV